MRIIDRSFNSSDLRLSLSEKRQHQYFGVQGNVASFLKSARDQAVYKHISERVAEVEGPEGFMICCMPSRRRGGYFALWEWGLSPFP